MQMLRAKTVLLFSKLHAGQEGTVQRSELPDIHTYFPHFITTIKEQNTYANYLIMNKYYSWKQLPILRKMYNSERSVAWYFLVSLQMWNMKVHWLTDFHRNASHE